MSENPIRVGFIGAGGICKIRHLPGLAQMTHVEVRSVCNRSEQSSRKVAEEWSIPEIDRDWRELIARNDIDAVFIGTWPYTHMEMAVAALDAGKHVFCQARMARDLAEAKRMVAAAAGHPELVSMLCPPPTRMPWEPYIRRLIVSGELGELREVHVTSLNGANLDTDQVTFRERVELSGNQVLAVGIFAETLNAWVGEYDRLEAVTATPIATKSEADGSEYPIRIPQTVMIQGRLQNGAAISEHHSGLWAHGARDEIVIAGSRGTLRVVPARSIEFARVGEELTPVDVPADEQRDWQVESDFIEAVRRARAGEQWEVSPDFHEGLRYMRKVEALHVSARTGRVVLPASL